jgi:phage protein D
MTPDFRITVAGEDATAPIRDRLLSLTLTDEDGDKADRLEIEIDDRDGAVEFPDMEAILDVALGFKGQALAPMGQFAVDALGGEGPVQSLRITATAADLKGDIRAPRTRAWEGKSLSDIVATIAGEAGLRPVVGASVAGTVWDYLAQTAESNLHFLTRITATLDATCKPAGGTLLVQRRGEGQAASGEALTAPALGPDRMSTWSWDLDGRVVYKSVEAEWRDIATGEVHKITKGSGAPLKKLRHVHATEAEATRAAEAVLSGAARGAMTINAECSGFHPGLLAGATVTLSGMPRPELDGEWQLKTVTHRLTSSGLTTGFAGEKGTPQ